MCKYIWATAKLNLRTIESAYWSAWATAGVFLVQAIVFAILTANGVNMGGEGLSIGNYLWLLPAVAAIQIPAYNYRRIMNLGAKRDNFFWGSLWCYAIIAAVVSLVNTLMYYFVDSFMNRNEYFSNVLNAVEGMGWAENGVLAVFFQQFAFLLLLAVFIHTLVAVQGKWYGWATNVAIIAIISVFTPIAPLRAVLAGFFYLIIFANPFLQVMACLVLAAGVYGLNVIVFARKAI